MLQSLSLIVLALGINTHATDLLIGHRAYTRAVVQTTLVNDAPQRHVEPAIALLSTNTEQRAPLIVEIPPLAVFLAAPTHTTTALLHVFCPGLVRQLSSRPPPVL